MTTTSNPLPHPADLHATQALLQVDGYDEYNDMFVCLLHTAAPCDGQACSIPALLLPMLVHEYGEPCEFVNRTFLVEAGARRADYARVHGALLNIIEDTQLLGTRDRKPVDAVYITAGEQALNRSPDPSQL